VPRIGTLPLTAITACGPPSRDQRANLTHFRSSLSGRQVLLFHTSACDELTPPIHRAPPRPHAGRSPAEGAPRKARLCFGPPHTVRFRCRRCLFRCVSSGSHTFVFSSHTCPATAGLLPQRSPPRLLTDAACGGLGSPPARRTRRAHLHHWYSTLHAGDLLHRHHSTSGHTWVPRTVSRPLISAFAARRPRRPRRHGSQAAQQDRSPWAFDSRTWCSPAC
jgi:hypothetical protein